MFYFFNAAVSLLSENTWAGEVTVKNWLRNYAEYDEPFWIKTRKPGNSHYRVRPVPGGYKITPCKMYPAI